jgi:HEAT repeat protein
LGPRDPEWLAFACLMERVFFFQPLNRLARRQVQVSAEYQADAWAASRAGGVPLARCLVKVAEWIQASPLGVPVAGMAEERSQLASRVARLLESSGLVAPAPRRSVAFLSAGAVAAMVLFAPGVMGRPAHPADPADPAQSALENNAVTSGDDLLATDAQGDMPTEDKGKGDKGPKDEPVTYPTPDPDAYTDPQVDFNVDGDKPVTKADTAVVRALIARLRDDDAQVRQAAAHALGRIGNTMAIAPLVTALDDGEPEVQAAALDALSNFDRGVPAAPIRRMLQNGNSEVRHSALHILANLRDRESGNAIAALVRDNDADVRQTALQALKEIGDPAFAAAMVGALTDMDADVREAALQALAEVGGTIPDEAMRRALRDADEDVRDAAIHVVEERRLVSMVPELIRMLEDVSADIRECAAEALTEVRTEQSHAALKAALNHRDPAVRRVAVEYFGEEGDS